MENIALSAHATQSTYSKWSSGNEETLNLLTGNAPKGYAFHTLFEKFPYVIIDLKCIYPVREIKIFPREDKVMANYSHEYCPYLEILVSTNGYEFKTIYSDSNMFIKNNYISIYIYDEHMRFIILKSKNCFFALKKIEIFRDPNILNFRNINIAKSKFHSPSIIKQIEQQIYERNELDIVLNSANNKDIILELGANIGCLACCIIKNITPSKYYAVEANPYLINEIKNNLNINNLYCDIANCIMTNEPIFESDFFISENILASSMIRLKKFTEIKKIECKNLNKFIREKKITYMIVDIEGGEYQIFDENIDLTPVNQICLELHPSDIVSQENLIDNLKRKGFHTNSKYHPGEVGYLHFIRQYDL